MPSPIEIDGFAMTIRATHSPPPSRSLRGARPATAAMARTITAQSHAFHRNDAAEDSTRSAHRNEALKGCADSYPVPQTDAGIAVEFPKSPLHQPLGGHDGIERASRPGGAIVMTLPPVATSHPRFGSRRGAAGPRDDRGRDGDADPCRRVAGRSGGRHRTYRNPLEPTVPGDGIVESCADPTVIRGQEGEGLWYMYCTDRSAQRRGS